MEADNLEAAVDASGAPAFEAAPSAAAAAAAAAADAPLPPLPLHPLPPQPPEHAPDATPLSTLLFFVFLAFLWLVWAWPYVIEYVLRPLQARARAVLGLQPSQTNFADVEAGRRSALNRMRDETAAASAVALARLAAKDSLERERLVRLLHGDRVVDSASADERGGRRLATPTPARAAAAAKVAAAAAAAVADPIETAARERATAQAAVGRVAPRDLPLPEPERRRRRRALALARLGPEPAAEAGAGSEAACETKAEAGADPFVVLALRFSSARGEGRLGPRRFRASDPAQSLSDWAEAEIAGGGFDRATIRTIAPPRRVLALWLDYDLAELRSEADFERVEAQVAGGAHRAADGPTIASLGVETRSMLELTRDAWE